MMGEEESLGLRGTTGVDAEVSLPLSLLDNVGSPDEVVEDPAFGAVWLGGDGNLRHTSADVGRAATSMGFARVPGGIEEVDAGGGGWGGRQGDEGGRGGRWEGANVRGDRGEGGLFGKLPVLSRSSNDIGRCVSVQALNAE